MILSPAQLKAIIDGVVEGLLGHPAGEESLRRNPGFGCRRQGVGTTHERYGKEIDPERQIEIIPRLARPLEAKNEAWDTVGPKLFIGPFDDFDSLK